MNNNNCFDFLRFFFAFDILLAHLWELSESKSLFFLSTSDINIISNIIDDNNSNFSERFWTW